MKRSKISLLLAVCLLLCLFPRTEAFAASVKDAVVGKGYIVNELSTGNEVIFSYDTPENGATLLVFVELSACFNSQRLFDTLAEQPWINDDRVELIIIDGGNKSTPEDLRTLLNSADSQVRQKAKVYYNGNRLMWAYASRHCGLNSLSFGFVLCITDDGSGQYLQGYAQGVNSSDVLSNMLAAYQPSLGLDQETPEIKLVDVTICGTKRYDLVRAVTDGTNKVRAADNVSGVLMLDSQLTELAMQRAAEIALFYENNHRRPDGTECFTVFPSIIGQVGENIAAGQTTPAMVVNDWDNSPGHHANMVNSAFTRIGIGAFESNGELFWVQLFSQQASSGTVPAERQMAQVSITAQSTIIEPYVLNSTAITLEEGKTQVLPLLYGQNMGFPYSSYTLKPYVTAVDDSGKVLAQAEVNSGGRTVIRGVRAGSGTVTLTAYKGQEEGVSIPLTVEPARQGMLGETLTWQLSAAYHELTILDTIPETYTVWMADYDANGRMLDVHQMEAGVPAMISADTEQVKLFYTNRQQIPQCVFETIELP